MKPIIINNTRHLNSRGSASFSLLRNLHHIYTTYAHQGNYNNLGYR